MKKIIFTFGLAGFVLAALACDFDTPTDCQEAVVQRTIHIDWANIPGYPDRVSPCLPAPGVESWSPLFSTAISPGNGLNIFTKGYVQLNIKLANETECTLAKDYTTLQYYIQPGTDDLVIEVPVKDVYFTITYVEACTNCTQGFATPRRATFRSSSLVSEVDIASGNIINLIPPKYTLTQTCQ